MVAPPINNQSYRPEDDEVIRLVSLPDHVLRVLIWYILLGCTNNVGVTTRVTQAKLITREHTESVVRIRREIRFDRAQILRDGIIVVDPRIGGEGRVVLDRVAEYRGVVLAAGVPLDRRLLLAVETLDEDVRGLGRWRCGK